jgi:hypothetical protein
MAVWGEERFAFVKARSEGTPYSVRRCIAIIGGLSLGFWGLLGVIIYKMM